MTRFVLLVLALLNSSVVLAQPSPPEKPNRETPKLVDEPQLAIILTKENRRMRIFLVSLDRKELRYKRRQTDKTAHTYTTGQIKAVQIASGDVFAVNPKTSAFERYDPATGTFVPDEEKATKATVGDDAGRGEGAKAEIQRVIAEGSGTSAEKALKDAFRNAVRQAVGAVVDAETLLKNDEVISDKVLTYSDGFIKKYEEVGKKQEDGLFRIKIKADVERRSVIAKLKAANVSVKSVDGKGLFAQAFTQEEARKNATELLKKALKDLPTFLTAVASKPDYDSKSSEVVLHLALKVDEKAYGKFLRRLMETLKKASLRQCSSVILSSPLRSRDAYNRARIMPTFESGDTVLLGPTLTVKERQAICIWVNTFRSSNLVSTKWVGYVVDADFGRLIDGLSGHFNVSISLLDSDGKAVFEDEFRYDGKPIVSSTNVEANEHLPFLWHAVLRGVYNARYFPSAYADLKGILKTLEINPYRPVTANLFVCPFSFTVKTDVNGGTRLVYQPAVVLRRRMKVDLDDLKKVDRIACKVSYQSGD